MHALTLFVDLNSSCTVRAGGSAASDLVIQVVMIAESTRLQCMLANYGIQVARVSFHTGTGNIVPRLVTDLTDFFGENKEFSMILGKNWNFKVVFD